MRERANLYLQELEHQQVPAERMEAARMGVRLYLARYFQDMEEQ
ncbi:MAG: hypothetical protein ABI324_07110 [Ktedonobacteraceae bacterium]